MGSIPRSDFLDVAAPATRLGSPTRRRYLVPVLALALSASTLWAAGASYCLLFHDEILAGLVAQQRAQQVAYEEHVGALQAQTERAVVETALGADGIESRLVALADRQALIEKRQGLLSNLGSDPLPPRPAMPDALPFAAEQAPERSPVPEAPELAPSLELRTRGGDRAEISGRRLSALEGRLDRLSEQQAQVLSDVAARASRNAGRLRSAIRQAGLDPARFDGAERGVGGPFVPVSGDAFILALAQAQRSIEDERRLARAVSALPFRRPLTEAAVATSGFGTRLDPFTRGLALHTGIDLRADQGTAARATAPGRVAAAETAGGYGNMVEVDHGHGIVTRYAHLASFAVEPGQKVAAGTIVGRVGSTGRSTGNHLHYETRVDGEPVDPLRFLNAAARLGIEASGDR